MKNANVKTAFLASFLFAGFSMISCKGNDANSDGNIRDTEMTDESGMEANQGMGSEEDSLNGSGAGTATDSTGMNGRNNYGDSESGSGAGAQPTVPGGTAAGSGTGGASQGRP